MAENKQVKYCIYCGQQCTTEMAVCPKCNKVLDASENLFIEFLIDKTKDKYKGDLEDSLIEVLINFIKSHLYGFILTISIVGVAVTGVVSADPYIKKVTQQPGNDIVEVKNHYTSDQKAIKSVVDDYFYYARNIDNKVDAKEKLEKLMSPIITTEVMPGYPVTSTHEAVEVEGVDSVEYSYAIIDTDIEYATTIVSAEFMAKGYRVAEVVLYETMMSGNNVTEGLFLVTLIQQGNTWTVNESLSSYSDEKLAYYEEDYLYTLTDNILWGYNERYSVEEIASMTKPYLMPSKANLQPNVTIEASDSYYYYGKEYVFDVKYETPLAKQLQTKGYRVAQANLMRRENGYDEQGVITFVNMDGMWYVAEMVIGG